MNKSNVPEKHIQLIDSAVAKLGSRKNLAVALNVTVAAVGNWYWRGLPPRICVLRPDLFMPELAPIKKKRAQAALKTVDVAAEEGL